MRLICVAAISVALAACGGARISKTGGAISEPVAVIALDQGGGLLADAVGVQLSHKGYTVLDSGATGRLVARINLNEVEINTPQGLSKMADEGVDAYLVVRASGGYDQQPQSASARVSSTRSGRVLAGVTWQNGWGGQAGSIADRTMRQGLSEAAEDIADALSESMPLKQ